MNPKSRFDNIPANNQTPINNSNYQRNLQDGMSAFDIGNGHLPSSANHNNLLTSTNDMNESNQMFERILSDVIHVSTFEPKGFANADISNQPGQDIPFKIKGLLESNKQQMMLPDGVPAPLSVLAAQPPFSSDINFICNLAQEAQACINGFTLQVPANVAFDFNPVNA